MGPGLPKGKEEPSEVWRWFLRGRMRCGDGS